MLTSHNYTERFFFYNYYNDLKFLKISTKTRRELRGPERHPGGSGAWKREAMVVAKESKSSEHRGCPGPGDPSWD